MALNVTLGDLKTRVRQRADQQSSNFISDSELLDYINGSYTDLYDMLVSTNEAYYISKSNHTIASNQNTITVPNDFYKIKGLDFKVDNDSYISLGQFDFSKRNTRDRVLTRSLRGYSSRQYRLLGDTIYIEPEGSAPGDYRLWYIPAVTLLSDDSDQVDGVNGWEEYIVVDSAIKCLVKEESNTTQLERHKAQIAERIQNLAADRDYGAPDTIEDTRHEYNYYFDDWYL